MARWPGYDAPRCAVRLGALFSVIVSAAHVIAAMGADQFAVVSGQAMAAGWADLAMVIDTGVGRLRLKAGFCGAILCDFGRGIGIKVGIQGARPLRQHARQISMEERPSAPWHSGRRPMASCRAPHGLPFERLNLNGARQNGARGNPTKNQRDSESPKEELWQARQVRFGQVH